MTCTAFLVNPDQAEEIDLFFLSYFGRLKEKE